MVQTPLRSFSLLLKRRKRIKHILTITWNICWNHYPGRRSAKKTLFLTIACPGPKNTRLMRSVKSNRLCSSLPISAHRNDPGRHVRRTLVRSVRMDGYPITKKEYSFCNEGQKGDSPTALCFCQGAMIRNRFDPDPGRFETLCIMNEYIFTIVNICIKVNHWSYGKTH